MGAGAVLSGTELQKRSKLIEKTGVDLHSGHCLPVFSIKVQQPGKRHRGTKPHKTHESATHGETPRAGASLVRRVAIRAANPATFMDIYR